MRRKASEAHILASNWRTVSACHSPRPLKVGIPRRFNSDAMARSDVAPLACMVLMVAARSAARASARTLRIFRAVAAALACLLIVMSAPMSHSLPPRTHVRQANDDATALPQLEVVSINQLLSFAGGFIIAVANDVPRRGNDPLAQVDFINSVQHGTT
jgi:hypothetical protein